MPTFNLTELVASNLPQLLAGRLGVPATLGLLMLGLVGAVLGLISELNETKANDVDA